MIEIRFHGRGGQGTVVASVLLARAFFQAGYYVQSFPFFGVERRGAPVEAYLRVGQKKILLRTNVYTPDHVVVLDSTLLQAVDVSMGLRKGGVILLNSQKGFKELYRFAGYRLAVVDATKIALENSLGTRTRPIVNTAMIGALANILGMPPMDAVIQAILEEAPGKTDENIKAAEEAFHEVVLLENRDESE